MAWNQVHQTLRDHRKTMRLARILGCHRAKAAGHLVFLWGWALGNVPADGSLEGISDEDLKDQALWGGAADKFEAALVEAGFIDAEPRRLHDWPDYTGEFYKVETRRRQARERQRRSRASRAAVTPTSRATSQASHAPVTRDTSVTAPPSHAPRQRLRQEQESSLKTSQDRAHAREDRPQSQAEFEAAVRRAETREERDGLVLEAFHWQHDVLPLKKKRQALLGYCRNYGHAHVLETVFRAGEAFPDHPEAYVLKMLATPPTRDPTGADHKRRSEQALAELERMEAEA
ncbi:MAG: hypothetical protein OXG17_04235 [Chloroflexi bacterium]|nr:hypothetical protein [Chloroflexota bacterium]